MSSNKQLFYAVLTASDKGYAGERVDESGPLIQTMMDEAGYLLYDYSILPDEQRLLEEKMKMLCDAEDAPALLLTTGGTGLSPRDCTPEASLAIAERVVPGIAEAMRFHSMQYTKRAMLSRAVSVLRGSTLIINLPGSPKAVRENLAFIINELKHAVLILRAESSECAR